MYETYLTASRLLVDQALKIAVSRLGLSWLGGPVGVIVSFLISPFVALMVTEGFLHLEFAKFDFLVGKEKDEYQKAIDQLRKYEGKLSKEEKKELVKRIKRATKEFISLRKHLR